MRWAAAQCAAAMMARSACPILRAWSSPSASQTSNGNCLARSLCARLSRLKMERRRAWRAILPQRLNVDGRDPVQLAEALGAVWGSAERHQAQLGALRRDVLIMRMVDAKHSGVAFTEHVHAGDLVNFTEGLADKLVSGAMWRASRSACPSCAQAKSCADLPAWAQRLQLLLRRVRRVFSHKRSGRDWDIEWADDGTTCWLIQIRPITRPTRRNEAASLSPI